MQGRVYEGGLLDQGRNTPEQQEILTFFQGATPGTQKAFAWLPIWRVAEGTQVLDEIILGIDLKGTRFVKVNGKPKHGTWVYENGFLDVQCNCRFGEPGNKDHPAYGKWVRFQKLPGTSSWIRCEAYDDHTWVVFLTAIFVEGDFLMEDELVWDPTSSNTDKA